MEKSKIVSNLKVNSRRIGDSASTNLYEFITGDTVGVTTSKLKSPQPQSQPQPQPQPPKPKITSTSKPKKFSKFSKFNKKEKEIDLTVCVLDSDSEGW